MGDAPTLTEWLRSQGRSLGEPYILQERWYALLPKRVPQGIPVVEGSPVTEGAAADVAPLQAVVVDNQVDAKTVVRNVDEPPPEPPPASRRRRPSRAAGSTASLLPSRAAATTATRRRARSGSPRGSDCEGCALPHAASA